MKEKDFCILLGALILPTSLIWAQEPNNNPKATVIELRETIGKIVDLKALESRERIDWTEKKESMSQLLELYQEELTLLDEELELAGQSSIPHDEKKQEIEKSIEDLKELRRQTSEVIVREREKALRIAKMLPTPVLEEAAADLDALEGWRPGDEVRPVLQAILGLVSKSLQFNRRVSRVTEIRDGEEREVIYLGLARAYYASASGSAGVGTPAADGWQWQDQSSLHSDIRIALDQMKEQRPPEYVKLPLQVSPAAGKEESK